MAQHQLAYGVIAQITFTQGDGSVVMVSSIHLKYSSYTSSTSALVWWRTNRLN